MDNSMTIKIQIYSEGLKEIAARYGEIQNTGIVKVVRGRFQRMMRDLRETVRDEVPGSGGLRKYVVYRTYMQPLGIRGEIQVKSPNSDRYPSQIWDYLLDGTRPHEIRAVRANALRFYWPKVGKVVFFKRVWHPGTKPSKFVEEAYRKFGKIRMGRVAEQMAEDTVAWLERRA